MKEAKEVVALFLRQFVSLLESLDDADMEDLRTGRSALAISKSPGTRRGKTNAREDKAKQDDLNTIRRKLSSFVSREEADDYIKLMAPRRADLVPIAREMEIPIHSSDTIEKIRDKIVDATVGYRLRSQAIRGGT